LGSQATQHVVGRHSNVGQVAYAVARRSVHAAAHLWQRRGRSLGKGCVARYGHPRLFGLARALVTERDAVADRALQRRTLRDLAERRAPGIRKASGLAVPAVIGANPGCCCRSNQKLVEVVLAKYRSIQLIRRSRRSSARCRVVLMLKFENRRFQHSAPPNPSRGRRLLR
jgi:hypothetical protein